MSVLEKLSLLAVITTNSIPKVRADQTQLNNIVNGAFLIAGAISVLFIIIGAFRYITSQGESGALKTAKEMIIYSIVGLVIVILAFAITQIVIMVVSS